jgi:hypothetical protein
VSDLNDYNLQIDKGDFKAALLGLHNQVAMMIAEEQTTRIGQFRERKSQSAEEADHLAKRLEQIVYGLRTDLVDFRADFQTQLNLRFDAYGVELDTMRALLEERTAPFAELPARVERVELAVDHLEQGQTNLTARLDKALDPKRPGATIEMVKVQDRVRVLTWLVWGLIAVVIVQGMLLVGHHYYLWDRLR